ncbi:MAG: glycosyltransferase family 39 protein [Clostridiales bacterium]|nr:glycosyltransferase family 39 protein [Clostridiales bacterium]
MSKGKNKNKNKNAVKSGRVKAVTGTNEESAKESSETIAPAEEDKETLNPESYVDPDLDLDDDGRVAPTIRSSAKKEKKASSSPAKSEPSKKASSDKKEQVPFVQKLKSLFPLSFLIAFGFNLIYGSIFYSQYEAVSLYDTSSYFSAAEEIIAGRTDLLRTPVYPLFLHLCKKISPENVNRLAVTIQIVVFFISMWFFFRLVRQFTSNSVLCAAGTILYGCMTPITAFNFLMLTESFSISGLVIFAYLLVLFIKERKVWMYTVCIAMTLFLTLLRPSAVYLFVVVVCAAIPSVIDIIRKKINWKEKRFLAPPIAFAICLASLLGYMSMNRDYNNYFGLSYVSEMNKYYDVVQADIWHDNPDTEMVAAIQQKFDEGAGALTAAIDTELAFRNMDTEPDRLIEFNRNAIDQNTGKYVYYLAKKVLTMGYNHMEYNLSNDSYFFKEEGNKEILWAGDLMDFNVNYVYFIFLLSAIGIVAVAVRKKHILWSEIMIALIIGGQLAVNILAGPAEFHRLNAPCYPFSLLMVIVWAGIAYDAIMASAGKDMKEEESPESPVTNG